MERFAIEVDLMSPAIINTLTLDAILGAVLFEDLQDIDRAHSAIPLRCRGGLYHASVALPSGGVQFGSCTLIAGLRATHDIDLELIQKNRQGGPHRTIGLKRRSDFGNVRNSYRTVSAESLRWYAEGDPEQTLALLENVDFIGKKRTAGCGQVSRWRLVESQLDGIADASGLPLRPVPLTMWKGSPDAIRADAAWRPAYWKLEHRAVCAVPQGMVQ